MKFCARTYATTYTRTYTRTYRGLVAGVLAGGLLLTGCTGTDGEAAKSQRGGGSQADRGKGGSGGNGGQYAPGPSQPSAAPGQQDGAEGERKAPDAQDVVPPPDYLSTFALDVDTASYGYARRALADGRLPAPDTVRPEEFVNSFRQDYPRPDGNGFSVTVDGARMPGADRTDGPAEYADGESDGETGRDSGAQWSLVRVGLATRGERSGRERPPAALTFVVDISGSMAEPGRLDLVRTSLGILTDELRPDDSIALVTFSDRAETRLPMTRVGDNRDRIHDIVDDLEPTDSTNVEAGIRTGYDEAVEGRRSGATNRVVLLSDALANTGETSADAILDRIDNARRKHGITLFGVGVGSQYGDALMERLADKGDGHTTYVSNEEEARKVFCDQLPAHIELRARDAKAQVAFDPQTVKQFLLIGYDNRQVADEDFRDDRVDGGEVGPGHTVTALYAVRMRPGASGHVATASVRWLDPKSRSPHEESGRVETNAIDGALWGDEGDGGGDGKASSSRLQVTAVAAYFADELRGGALPGSPGLSELRERAEALARRTEDGAVRKLADAVGQASRLKG
ncbi:von Willebrand factor type A domain-containing protein [Streptomyces sp. 21So2-11]|uniref:vWA domain-containing protein n=1 Tax=Streptomyces sp. 21So2-11 TaxID=3144408 RepID=UPI00321B6B55